MSAWLIAALALLPALIVGVVSAARGAAARRLVAIQFATSIAVLLLVVLDFAFDQPSSMDLALTLALLSLPGTLVLALFQERWL
ncbi:MAG TPA: monovalent cation/H+ antiporter complex subunit F [Rhodanobacteraceae bacterium]|nr:monovalent cation/H+ antiporter complex subunit F [Rhodanobacteraceae bacterium]